MSSLDTIEKRWYWIHEKVNHLLHGVGRSPESIQIVAVTKGHSAEAIKKLYDLGCRDFGENYVNEWWEKKNLLASYPSIRWHFLGQIQSNKLNKIAQASVIHSVGSLKEALGLEAAVGKLRRSPVPAFLQVNLQPSDGRKGFTQVELEKHIDQLCLLPHLVVKGLMTVLPLDTLAHRPAEWMEQMRLYHEKLKVRQGCLTELSMGMSGDYQEAVKEGATVLRLGTVLLGERGV